jgi:hypothetical protein
MLPSSVLPATSRPPLQRWLIGLGWLGFGLMALELLASWWQLETTSLALSRAFHLLQAGLGLLWPPALVLSLRAWPRSDVPRIVLKGVAGLLMLPMLGWAVLSVGYWSRRPAEWQVGPELFVSRADPQVRVVIRTRDLGFATTWPQPSAVKLTPVLDLWQRAEPVDTAHFDETGWRRVNP